MFCDQCGNKLSEDANFCEKCGTKITEQLPIPNGPILTERVKKAGIKRPMIIKGAIAAAIVLVLVSCLVMVFVSTGKNYLYGTLSKSQRAYEDEISDFIEKNVVLNALKVRMSDSYTARFVQGSGSITLKNDKSKKTLHGELLGKQIPKSANLYITDSRLIAGIKDLAYFEINPKNMGEDFRILAESLELRESDVSSISEMLESVDLSYSHLMDAKALSGSDDLGKLTKRYTPIFKKLIGQAEYTKDKSTIKIGGKLTDVSRITLSADSDILAAWIKDDLTPVLLGDNELKKYWDAYNTYERLLNGRRSYDYGDLVDNLVDKANYMLNNSYDEISVTAKIHKGVIVELEIAGKYNGSKGNYIVVSALGDEYRINDISLRIGNAQKDNYYHISIVGEHIGEDIFSSKLSINNSGYMDSVSIEWDTKEVSDNLRIGSGSDKLKSTLALDGKDILAQFGNDYLRISSLEGSTELPQDTTLIREISESDVNWLMGIIFRTIF